MAEDTPNATPTADKAQAYINALNKNKQTGEPISPNVFPIDLSHPSSTTPMNVHPEDINRDNTSSASGNSLNEYKEYVATSDAVDRTLRGKPVFTDNVLPPVPQKPLTRLREAVEAKPTDPDETQKLINTFAEFSQILDRFPWANMEDIYMYDQDGNIIEISRSTSKDDPTKKLQSITIRNRDERLLSFYRSVPSSDSTPETIHVQYRSASADFQKGQDGKWSFIDDYGIKAAQEAEGLEKVGPWGVESRALNDYFFSGYYLRTPKQMQETRELLTKYASIIRGQEKPYIDLMQQVVAEALELHQIIKEKTNYRDHQGEIDGITYTMGNNVDTNGFDIAEGNYTRSSKYRAKETHVIIDPIKHTMILNAHSGDEEGFVNVEIMYHVAGGKIFVDDVRNTQAVPYFQREGISLNINTLESSRRLIQFGQRVYPKTIRRKIAESARNILNPKKAA